MKAFWSLTTGVLALERPKAEVPEVRRLNDEPEWTRAETPHLLSTIDDWEVIEDKIDEALLKKLMADYWQNRSAALARCLLLGLSASLAGQVLAEIEEILQGRARSPMLINMLLVAPLRKPRDAANLASAALSSGFAATGHVFEAVHDLQPALRRFSDLWLDLPFDSFDGLDCSRQQLWIKLVRSGTLLGLLGAANASSFKADWFRLLEELPPPIRQPANKLGEAVAERLFPATRKSLPDLAHVKTSDDAWERDEDIERNRPHRERGGSESGLERRDRALRQVNAIARAIAEGRDSFAHKALAELIESQKRDAEHAVMSLCNIAQDCAKMFRPDFEGDCLEAALSLDRGDSWTLNQYGDFLKRLGKYEESREVLAQAAAAARKPTDYIVAQSTVAGVFAQEGRFEEAINTYESISQWPDIVEVRTAIADIWRRRGDLDQAEAKYNEILQAWPNETRPLAGMAEIAKRRGSLGKALEIYDGLLAGGHVDKQSQIVYKLARCHILKLQGRLREAYQETDEVINAVPFWMDARILRGAILGLQEKAREGLKIIPAPSDVAVVDEWGQQYVRGLLLLQLKRYEDAKTELVTRFVSAIRSGDSDVQLRIGAALFFLYTNDVANAERFLSGIRESHDYYLDYVSKVLRLHVATLKSDAVTRDGLLASLAPVCEQTPIIKEAVDCLRRGDFAGALKHELRLALAA